jgi:glycosyltransferase involved in cell wall biosynthesis
VIRNEQQDERRNETTRRIPPSLIVFSDDWGRHPSSSQHLVRALLSRHEVTWINTIGMRPPRLDWITVKRGWEKLTHWRPAHRPTDPAAAARRSKLGSPPAAIAAPSHNHDLASQSLASQSLASPRVLNPVMWPSFHSWWGRAVNRRLLERAVRRVIQARSSTAGNFTTVMTTIPIVADLVGMPGVDRWVYYCVDDFSSWPGLDAPTMDRMEVQLVSRVDAIVSAGDNLSARMQKLGRQSTLIDHGVDLEFWQAAREPARATARLADLPRPIILFWGLIDRRLDVNMVRALAERLTEGTLVFVGPQQDPDPALATFPRILQTGPVSFEDLPSFAAAADLLVMPYDDLPVTRAMQPLKLKEYLATGKPVIVRRLPATQDWADCLDLVSDPDEFVGAVRLRLASGLPAEQQVARQRLSAEGWAAKALRLEEILFPADGVTQQP